MSHITAGKAFYLKDMVNVKEYQITSRTLSFPEGPAFTATEPVCVLYAMDKQETISSETSPKTKIIHVLEGELYMLVANEPCHLSVGASVIVQANTCHEFTAQSNCKFIQISI